MGNSLCCADTGAESFEVTMTTMAEIQMCIDVIFPVDGSMIPRDHGYALYAAAVHTITALHGDTDIGIFPIRGTPGGNGTLLLNERSTLRFRVPAHKLPMLLPLAGKSLKLDGHPLRVGVPHVAALDPAPVLASPFVLIKLAEPGHKQIGGIITPDAFLTAARKQLNDLTIHGEPGIQQIRSAPRVGQPRRRILRIKGNQVVGYAMIVQGLTAEESIRLQEKGMGGRRLMGCGLFLPVKDPQ
jgi:CRISPR-associated protein Cas6